MMPITRSSKTTPTVIIFQLGGCTRNLTGGILPFYITPPSWSYRDGGAFIHGPYQVDHGATARASAPSAGSQKKGKLVSPAVLDVVMFFLKRYCTVGRAM